MSVPVPPAKGRRWEAFGRLVIATYGNTCWLCGHGGARQVDHVIATADQPALTWKMENCRPAHGAPGNACATCSRDCGQAVYCNQLRGAMTPERFRRILAEKAAGNVTAARPARPRPDAGAGRPW
jgi:hypothetical protein